MEQYGYITEDLIPMIIGFSEEFYGVQEDKSEKSAYAMRDFECPSAKDTYMTYEDARRALRKRSLQAQRDKRIYRCDQCGYWHLTTKPGSHRRHCKGYNRQKGREEVMRICNLLSEDAVKRNTAVKVSNKAFVSCNLLSGWACGMSA